jgi:hypothetical protein
MHLEPGDRWLLVRTSCFLTFRGRREGKEVQPFHLNTNSSEEVVSSHAGENNSDTHHDDGTALSTTPSHRNNNNYSSSLSMEP